MLVLVKSGVGVGGGVSSLSVLVTWPRVRLAALVGVRLAATDL